MKIPFNRPAFLGKEAHHLQKAVQTGKLSGNGTYCNKCQSFFHSQFGFAKSLLTTSCTDALEMAAILLNIKPGDEVIMPSFTFVSTANAFLLRGAKPVFVDSRQDHPGMDERQIEALITSQTKAIVVVHYAGVACDMDKIMRLAQKHDLYVVEDAAQAVDSYYLDDAGKKNALGGIGHLGAFSFHETKNISAGEGGMLVVNDDQFAERAEIIWEKGTNRSAFFRGEIDKYGWVDIGSSFLPSELTAAFLYTQLEKLEQIQAKRLALWERYMLRMKECGLDKTFRLPYMPTYATNNAHMFYLICQDTNFRQKLIAHLKSRGVLAVFHYQSLHKSEFYTGRFGYQPLPNSERYSDTLLRLPMYYDLKLTEVDRIVQYIAEFCEQQA